MDVAELTDEVLARAGALGERNWQVDGIANVVVTADRHRLVQALLQLVSNSLAHTTEADTIALGSRAGSDELVLWVRDSGAGVPAELLDAKAYEAHVASEAH